MRAVDSYGTYDNWSAAKILDPFVLTKEQKREIPVVGDPDEIVMSRVKAFYNAIAALIEKECGLMAVPNHQPDPRRIRSRTDHGRQAGGDGQDPARRAPLQLSRPCPR